MTKIARLTADKKLKLKGEIIEHSPTDNQSPSFKSTGDLLVSEFDEGESFRIDSDKKLYINELEEGVVL